MFAPTNPLEDIGCVVIYLNDKLALPPFMVAFIQVQCVFGVMKSMVAGRNSRAVALQGRFYIENAWGELEWSHRASGRRLRVVAWAGLTVY